MKTTKLTEDQKSALQTFGLFLMDKKEKYLIIHGAAGSGKSTLINSLLTMIEGQPKLYSLLMRGKNKQAFECVLTATTNKAATVIEELTQRKATTLHSFLGLTVKANFKTGGYDLIKKKTWKPIYNKLIIVDESSMLNNELFDLLDQTALECKVVLIGDQYQLSPINQKTSIMENLNCPKITLNEIIRNTGIIQQTGLQFRDTVETGTFKKIPNESKLSHVDGPTFKSLINAAFTDKDYNINSAKILTWQNDRAIEYNNYVRKIKGYTTTISKGEYVFTNNPIINGSTMWPVDSEIYISDIGEEIIIQNIKGRMVELNNRVTNFLPNNLIETKELLKKLAKQKDWSTYFAIKETWLDIRPAYASTIHKAQGSTYNTVFIDLADISQCNIASDVARMLYVSISRAKHQVYLYGKLPPKYS